MRTRFNIALLLTTVVCMISVTAFAVEVRSDFDHHANFSQYKTYSWAKVDTPDPLWNDRVKEAVDRALTAKGWSQVPTGGDVSVVAVGTTHQKPTLRTFYDGFGGGWLWGGFGQTTTYVDNYTEGTLVVDLFDSASKKLIWRGSATDVLSGKPEKDEKKVDNAVAKMFDHFPPQLG